MANVKRKSDHSELMDGSGRLTKRQENQKALEVLARAKEVNKNRPIWYATSKDSSFMRSLRSKPKSNDKNEKEPKIKAKNPQYSRDQVLKFKYSILGKAYESGKSIEECCKLINIHRHNFRSYYDRYLIAKETYNL
ncbi:hypothetical protein DSC47_10150 [Elizabethkingia miricola]|uniref:hypothetical protein n=1 Tax=Elizabethkingia bruuniana TaxID=1756149 RepID=UPI00099910B7|nr:hypothetical protein [Elizabethkingia bruuniana]OPC66350.1 hypothetical protein BAY13_16565 [Elizabethkingia bruuniana]RBI91652.1 hypothetical protein DSC47_10150 [Elizabethkingia miricola]